MTFGERRGTTVKRLPRCKATSTLGTIARPRPTSTRRGSCAVPTNDRATHIDAVGGHGAREALPFSEAVPAPIARRKTRGKRAGGPPYKCGEQTGSMRHQHWQRRIRQDVAGGAAENHLPQP